MYQDTGQLSHYSDWVLCWRIYISDTLRRYFLPKRPCPYSILYNGNREGGSSLLEHKTTVALRT